MTVHFIGAGPGAPDLLTLRGRDLIAACPVCLYAGSLVPEQILEHCPQDARVINTAPLSLDEIIAEMRRAHAAGLDVARLHSGDLSVWSATGEQLRRLRELDIPYTLTPGVPSFAAAAAALGQELTLPGVAQSVVLTRTSGRASPMPDGETLANFARTGTTLAIHLSIHNLARLVEELLPFYGVDCPVAIVWRASWPDQRIVRGHLASVASQVDESMQRTALIVVGPVLQSEDFQESCLYAIGYDRRFRPQSADSPFAMPATDEVEIGKDEHGNSRSETGGREKVGCEKGERGA
ncbi:precorrin-4 C(11)-methyltransferase [Halomonas binhaiensis]|uniref:Precorrin-4 C(11)-methyltransferase n=1 Tax=Halomonas binhaiensis TaxID=2562282 RepID=A0A5C1NDY2_9GAMM|nr:precorrin-4 C(11)-methyltransferase [Halomonas binhaiensis]QEM81444.1 precorrin-4 C(11)-methyltransferase [Halomonas binhaiensis]